MPERDFLDDIRDMKRRLGDLERSTQLPQFAEGGDLDEGYDGLLVLDRRETVIDPADPSIVALLIAQGGLELPALGVDWSKANDFQSVTSGTFQGTYTQQYHQATADGYHADVTWATSAGTTGQLRLHLDTVGGTDTTAVTLPANSTGTVAFNWLHTQPVQTSPFRPQVQARRTGGGGTVFVFAPLSGYQIGGRWVGATLGGT